ncbi:class I SAM-dependent methyltransferase [Streptomyces chromofuscus]|uniref:Class I SAM-dependent methyltransferase n=1 Tax=Streptomyces chromofuscus TaxID=42881 RepID=A0A7M2TA82_STRCW|nr:class I SAM-dependent methyltransferase [Streptomyces chromofuscus]QOV44843.1 class I SAM-dependent methyltransferase [Streptomyces chromofuscus]GGT33608.1 methyltransferase type 11 [Streptomyces chromofuscus]
MRDDTPDETRRVRLSRTFDEDAELYDRARPGYPPELFDDLTEVAGIEPGCHVLEVGPGTGQATLPLAERGCRITAVELGADMAAVARRNLAGFAAVEIVTADFETWPLPQEPFDAVVSATAFHWIDPAVRMTKAADALRPGGALAVVATQHVAGGSAEFFVEVQECYERFDPATPPGLRLPSPQDVDTSDHADEVARSGRFGPVVFRRYAWDLTYSTAEYLEVLRTYSGHRALPPEARDGLLECIAGLIDRRYGGRVTKRYLTELRVARAAPSGRRRRAP